MKKAALRSRSRVGCVVLSLLPWRSPRGVLSVLLLVILLLPGCGFTRPDNLKLITATQLHAVMQQQDILLIDVHMPEQAHIQGTDFYAPFYKIDDFAARLPTGKQSPIYLYCETGPMGNWAARTLFDMGYTNVYNLKGGSDAWKQARLPFNSN